MTTPSRWRRVEEIYHEASAREGKDRATFLADACAGDDGLRREVESLLGSPVTAEGFLAAPAVDMAAWIGRDPGASVIAGERLGVYRLQERVGAGGMGDVYRARDTRLGRDVAIKILPRALAADPDRLPRFEREARLLAALNHPNIATIHGVEDRDGIPALVMEFVDGPTLADRIAKGPIPLDESLLVAKQIADALEAAHEQGVVHRDLKPANIKVRPDGTVKILDFGLAKLLAGGQTEAAPADEYSQAPTAGPAMTQAGAILGTPAYMSPEQAAGRAADKRSDLWSFGVVLLEMLTGQPVFTGTTVPEVLASVLKDSPDWTKLPPKTPQPVRTLLRRCLERDRKKRLGDAADARLEIENALTRSPADAAALPAVSPALGRPWLAVLALAALIAVVIGVRTFRSAPPLPEVRTEISTPASTDPLSFALSPDGRELVFVASGQGASRLWLRKLDSTVVQPLGGTEGAGTPFWSPDSRSIGFFADGKLKRLDIGGSSPLVLADGVARGGTWNADGVILFTRTTPSPLFRVSAGGGESVAVTSLDRQLSHRFPSFLPNGRQFLFYAQGTPDTGGIYLGSLGSDAPTRLTAAGTAGMYVAPGWLLWVRAGTLVAQRLDLEQRMLIGEPVRVADPVGADGNAYLGAFSASPAGLVAYRPGGVSRRQLSWFDRSGKALGTLGAPDDQAINNPRVSPDGRRAAVFRSAQGNTDIWLLDGTHMSRFTFDAAFDRYPLWSPDGSHIVFTSNRKGAQNLYMKSSGGTGDEVLFLESPQDKIPSDWSHDGRFLLYHSRGSKTDFDLWVLPFTGDRKPSLLLSTGFDERLGQFSPDGRWVAYMSNESGRFEIYVRPFVEPAVPAALSGANQSAGQWQVSTAGGLYPRWRSDGKELYYIGPAGQMMAAPITFKDSSMETTAPARLFDTAIVGGGTENGQGRQYDVTADGRFLINTILDEGAIPLTLLQNWAPPARVP